MTVSVHDCLYNQVALPAFRETSSFLFWGYSVALSNRVIYYSFAKCAGTQVIKVMSRPQPGFFLSHFVLYLGILLWVVDSSHIDFSHVINRSNPELVPVMYDCYSDHQLLKQWLTIAVESGPTFLLLSQSIRPPPLRYGFVSHTADGQGQCSRGLYLIC